MECVSIAVIKRPPWYLLRVQGVGLCHGISGSGYALLSLYRATGERSYLSHAQQFALYIAQHWQDMYDIPDRPGSLYEVS